MDCVIPLLSLEDGAMGCSAALDAAKGVPYSAGVPQGDHTMEEHPKQPSLLTIIPKEIEPQSMDRWVSLEQRSPGQEQFTWSLQCSGIT